MSVTPSIIRELIPIASSMALNGKNEKTENGKLVLVPACLLLRADLVALVLIRCFPVGVTVVPVGEVLNSALLPRNG